MSKKKKNKNKGRNTGPLRCTFCGKSDDEVEHLIAGLSDAKICSECIEICNEVIENDQDNIELTEEEEEDELLEDQHRAILRTVGDNLDYLRSLYEPEAGVIRATQLYPDNANDGMLKIYINGNDHPDLTDTHIINAENIEEVTYSHSVTFKLRKSNR